MLPAARKLSIRSRDFPMRRFILLMVLAWLPAQASAIPWLALTCEQHGAGTHQHGAQHAEHAHESNATVAADQHAAGGEDPEGVNGAHASCCPHFSGVVHTLPVFADGTVATGVPLHLPPRLHDFIPDLPKRPPLADLV